MQWSSETQASWTYFKQNEKLILLWLASLYIETQPRITAPLSSGKGINMYEGELLKFVKAKNNFKAHMSTFNYHSNKVADQTSWLFYDTDNF